MRIRIRSIDFHCGFPSKNGPTATYGVEGFLSELEESGAGMISDGCEKEGTSSNGDEMTPGR